LRTLPWLNQQALGGQTTQHAQSKEMQTHLMQENMPTYKGCEQYNKTNMVSIYDFSDFHISLPKLKLLFQNTNREKDHVSKFSSGMRFRQGVPSAC
jgi:hypothetical protein